MNKNVSLRLLVLRITGYLGNVFLNGSIGKSKYEMAFRWLMYQMSAFDIWQVNGL